LEYWSSRLTAISTQPATPTPTAKARQTIQFLDLLTEVLGDAQAPTGAPHHIHWASQACSLLAANLEESIAIETFAERMNMSADSFRRRFRRDVGLSPMEYRQRKKIDLACLLLRSTTMTHAKIADRLGFSDEYHFSKRFRQQMNETPRDFRRRSA
jgi:AraC-like DNA-binding protein